MDPSEPLKKDIAVYIAQTEAVVVVVELFKLGVIWDTWYMFHWKQGYFWKKNSCDQ